MKATQKHMQFVSPEMARAVRRKRGELNLSQVELAKTIGISRMTLRKIETGNTAIYPKMYALLDKWLMEQV